jgi:hypothetical protein
MRPTFVLEARAGAAMMRRLGALVIAGICVPNGFANPQVQVTAAPAAPQPVGTVVTFRAVATDTDPGQLAYRFSVGSGAGGFRVLRDYSVSDSFTWTQVDHEGLDQIQVTVRNNATLQKAALSVYYEFTSRVSGSQPVVSSTANPLVALFSAPPCAPGSSMRVRFRKTEAGSVSYATSTKPCVASGTRNFYVAGMQATSTYEMHAEIMTGSSVASGPSVWYATGAIPPGTIEAQTTVVRRASTQDSLRVPHPVVRAACSLRHESRGQRGLVLPRSSGTDDPATARRIDPRHRRRTELLEPVHKAADDS